MRLRTHSRWLAWSLAAVVGAWLAPVRAQIVPLFVIPTESRVTQTVPPGAPLRVILESPAPARLAGTLGVPPPLPGATSIEYTVGASSSGPPTENDPRTWLESTFVIDHDDPAIAALRDEFRSASKGPVTADALAHFVSRKMQPSTDHGWTVASVVARSPQGDCTEHAVLTAAVARALGVPSRVATGVVLTRMKAQYGTFGHAWAEILDGGHWIVADAALAGSDAEVRYLPLLVLRDEGPGFLMQLFESMTAGISRVVVLGAGPAATPPTE